jgi:thiol-disulfide isomerase/thioredoxin
VKKLLGVALLGLTLSACDNSLLTSGDQGFVSSSGEVRIVPVEDRERPDPISGTSLTGEPISLDDLKGKVVVMPIWGWWCGPCRKEAPMFEAASKELASQNVAFLGIHTKDASEDNVKAFVRTTGITYPSIQNPSGSLLLNFNAGMSPNVIPSVAFIDPEGRVAAVVRGEITRNTLDGVIEDISS